MERKMNYIELHCHSNFSFLQGASHPEDLIASAQKLGYPALALTDRNGLYGIVRFNEAARHTGVRPIFGAEIVLENGSQLVLLVKNQQGYSHLSQLLSEALLNHKKGEARVDEQALRRHTDGLIALSGNTLDDLLRKGDLRQATKIAASYAELFGRDDFYLELNHHKLPAQQMLCEKLTSMGKALGIATVAANNVYYALPEERKVQDVLTCIKHHVTFDQAHTLLYPNAERYLKPARLMQRLLAAYPEAIANTVRIADQCQFELRNLPTVLPDFPVPPGESAFSYLKYLTYQGAHKRYGSIGSRVQAQLEHELSIIERLSLSGYFLIVWDITRFCTINGILCQGRGSAANSAVCYCLGITAVDPIKLDLLFERFLSEERTEPPDIDVDIASDRREEVIQYVYNKYGRRHAAMVCNVITYRRRSAVREVGKALGFSLEEVDKLSKRLDHFSDDEAEMAARVREAGFDPDSSRVRLWVELSRQIRGFPRHLGIHVGGMVITKTPLVEVVPVENAAMPDRSVIQWDKDDTADVGLVKIDLLGLGMLTMIDMAIKQIRQERGITVDPAQLLFDDPAVYDLLCRAETLGVFQVESRAQMNTLPRHKPSCFYDLVVEVALIRPGPIQGDMVHPYLRRRNGEEEIVYPHPMLEPILKRTLGVPLFQEQGMRVAITAAGFTPTQAEELRRAMGHKRSKQKIAALSEALIAGMLRNGIDPEAAEKIYHQLASFADFGFAESHAASFALLVYVSAHLKVYYPQEFYCALLNAQPMGFYTPSSIVYEAKRRGIEVLGVDVTKSRWDCTIENGQVRMGLRYVKSLGEGAKERLEEEGHRGPFVSIEDFVFRTRLPPPSLEQLAKIGALAGFGLSRRQALWKVLSLVRQSPQQLPMRVAHNGSHLLSAMEPIESIRADFMGMDLSTQDHPMSLFRASLSAKGIMSAAQLRQASGNGGVFTAGMVVIRQRPVTAKGFVFLTLEDETGFANIVVKPRLAKLFRNEVMFASALMVQGVLERKDGVVNVVGRKFFPFIIDGDQLKFKSRDFR
ncbi:MAG TPA: error-prone DNA polymerase [Candidatus Deferrimicrobium sp.]|nr:error-prone DNA polymerase [Candidatus Deferrimicrobium sp.]